MIRGLIKQYFPKLTCHSLVQPTSDDELCNIENMFYTALNKEFQDTCEKMINEDILANPKPKRINNKPVTGYMLLGLALEYVDCLNREEPPVVA